MSQNLYKKNNNELDDRSKRLVILGLSIFSLAAIFFGFWKINDSIYAPFYVGEKIENEEISLDKNSSNCTGSYCVSEIESKSKDSDFDGLNDWEEVNIYQTSPYIEDTDGDGINDKEEIANKTNPNCPEGSDCDNNLIDYYGENSLNRSMSELQFIEENIYAELEEKDQSDLENILSGGVSPDALRQLLISGGLDEEVVEAFSDKELTDLYTEILEENKE